MSKSSGLDPKLWLFQYTPLQPASYLCTPSLDEASESLRIHHFLDCFQPGLGSSFPPSPYHLLKPVRNVSLKAYIFVLFVIIIKVRYPTPPPIFSVSERFGLIWPAVLRWKTCFVLLSRSIGSILPSKSLLPHTLIKIIYYDFFSSQITHPYIFSLYVWLGLSTYIPLCTPYFKTKGGTKKFYEFVISLQSIWFFFGWNVFFFYWTCYLLIT